MYMLYIQHWLFSNFYTKFTIKKMAFIYPVNGIHPVFGNNCFVAPNATIVGDVRMGDECSVWFNAVVRGDVNKIRIGNKVNIQDNEFLILTLSIEQLHNEELKYHLQIFR